MNVCEICRHPFSEKHRLIPGSFGGIYVAGNVANLCPNHHAAIHFLMSWFGSGKSNEEIDAMGKKDRKRFNAYFLDKKLMSFFYQKVMPLCKDMIEIEKQDIKRAIEEYGK